LLRIICFPPERKGERLVHREARPRSDMDLLVLGVYGVFGEWLQMLPAAKRGEPPDVGSFMHRNVATVAFAEHFPLRMVGRGLRRLAMVSPSGPINHCEM